MAKIAGPIILGCWIIFLLYWLLSAMRVKPMVERQSVGSALAHRIPLGFSYLLLADRHWPPPMNRLLIPYPNWIMLIGADVCVVGLAVTLWARWTLAGNWSSDVTFKQGHELIQTGPYCFVRHPIYTGLLMMCLGIAFEIGRLRGGLALLLMAVAFWMKLKQEERLMLRHFPNEYPAHRKRVKALVPFVI